MARSTFAGRDGAGGAAAGGERGAVVVRGLHGVREGRSAGAPTDDRLTPPLIRTIVVKCGATTRMIGMVKDHDAGAQTSADVPIRVSVSLGANDYALLKVIAKSKRVSLAWVVRDAVSDYLDARSPLLARKRGSALS